MSLQGYKSLFAVADFYHYHHFCHLLWFFGLFLKEKGKRQIALQQDPFRSLFDSLTLFVRFKRDLFICFPRNGLGGGRLSTTKNKKKFQSEWCVQLRPSLFQ